MSQELPCLFCFTPQHGYPHQQNDFQGDRSRVEQCYKFLCDLLGIKILPAEDFFVAFGLGDHSSGLPLCTNCSLDFRNLSILQDELINLQGKINLMAEQIRIKIRNSDQDGSFALAFAIQSISDGSSRGNYVGAYGEASSSRLTWMQRFRDRVIQNSSAPIRSDHQQHHQSNSMDFLISQANTSHPQTIPYSFCIAQQEVTTTAASSETHKNDDGDEYFNEHVDDDPDWSSPNSPVSPNKKTNFGTKRKVNSLAAKSHAISSKARRRTKGPPLAKKSRKEVDSNDPLKKLKCHFCGRGFRRMYHLRAHLPLHTGQMNFKCEQCNQFFVSTSAIQNHNKIFHGSPNPYQCPICPSIRRITEAALKVHMKSHQDGIQGPPYLCTICNDGKEFKRKIGLQRHIRGHNDKKEFKCVFCPSKFARKDDMTRHMVRKHRETKSEEVPDGKFRCNLCPNDFPTSADLITHIISHGIRKNPMCQICNMAFNTRFDLATHNQEVHGIELTKYPCPNEACDIILFSQKQLDAHIKIHEPKSSGALFRKRAICDICSKSFSDLNTMKRHKLYQHENAAPAFSCTEPDCTKAYKRKTELKQHILIAHRGYVKPVPKRNEEDIKCKDCTKKFASIANLRRHVEIIHTTNEDIRPHKCTTCGVGFKRKDDMMRHMRTKNPNHTAVFAKKDPPKKEKQAERKKCEKCEKEFKSINSYNRHCEEVHGSKRPFPCDVCDFKFMRNSELIRHLKNVHSRNVKGDDLICPFCEKNFLTLPHFQIHLKTHTGKVVIQEGEAGQQIVIVKKERVKRKKRGYRVVVTPLDKDSCELKPVGVKVNNVKSKKVSTSKESFYNESSSSSSSSDEEIENNLKSFSPPTKRYNLRTSIKVKSKIKDSSYYEDKSSNGSDKSDSDDDKVKQSDKISAASISSSSVEHVDFKCEPILEDSLSGTEEDPGLQGVVIFPNYDSDLG